MGSGGFIFRLFINFCLKSVVRFPSNIAPYGTKFLVVYGNKLGSSHNRNSCDCEDLTEVHNIINLAGLIRKVERTP